MNDAATAYKMLAMRLPECNILKNLRQILFATDMDIPSTHVGTSEQRYNTLCKQLCTITLFRMYYPMLAVLNVVDLLKYWHMTFDADNSQASRSSSSQTAGR